MQSYFTHEFFEANRARLREQLQTLAPIVVTANGLLQRGGDSSFPFSQDANFWYLTGIDEPDITLVMDGPTEYLIVPARSDSRQAFDGSVDDSALTERSGITDIYSETLGWPRLSKRLTKTGQLATLTPPASYVEAYGLYTNPARAALIDKLQHQHPGLEIIDIGNPLALMRMIKQPAELKAIEAAIAITLTTIKEVSAPARLAKYQQEYEIEADISRGFRRRGAAGHAFEPIVASGKQAVTLHNVANNGQLQPNELLIMDVGAEVEHYAADITRTVSLGQPTRRQKAVHAAVYDVQQYAMSLLKPGVLLHDYEQQVEQYMGEKLRELGLLKTISHEAVRKYYPHASSHFLGLNVHDVGAYDMPLEPGTVITVEPGIYIPEEGIGVRIEDNVLITATGIKVLSARLPGSLS